MVVFPSFVIKQYQQPEGKSGGNSFELCLPTNLGLLTVSLKEADVGKTRQMYGRDPGLVPIFLAVLLCCPLSLSVVPTAF